MIRRFCTKYKALSAFVDGGEGGKITPGEARDERRTGKGVLERDRLSFQKKY